MCMEYQYAVYTLSYVNTIVNWNNVFIKSYVMYEYNVYDDLRSSFIIERSGKRWASKWYHKDKYRNVQRYI